MYTPFRVRTGIHTYNNDYKTTKIVALTDKKKKRILINAGFLYTFEEIKNKKMIPTLSLSYLIK